MNSIYYLKQATFKMINIPRSLTQYTIENASMYSKYSNTNQVVNALNKIKTRLNIDQTSNVINVHPLFGFEFKLNNPELNNLVFYTEYNPFTGRHFKGDEFQSRNITTNQLEYHIGNIGNINIIFEYEDDENNILTQSEQVIDKFVSIIQPYCDDIIIPDSYYLEIDRNQRINAYINSFITSYVNDVKECVM